MKPLMHSLPKTILVNTRSPTVKGSINRTCQLKPKDYPPYTFLGSKMCFLWRWSTAQHLQVTESAWFDASYMVKGKRNVWFIHENWENIYLYFQYIYTEETSLARDFSRMTMSFSLNTLRKSAVLEFRRNKVKFKVLQEQIWKSQSLPSGYSNSFVQER